MGIRGLTTYIHEHLHEVLARHKLQHRRVVIDGNNLAHILYYECTGINAAFGGDYDKYASFVEEFFKGLEACDVSPIVIMDGGQPLDNKKMNTVRDRITNQIQTCLHISPSSQHRMKVFPCMGRDVFVSTLRRMNVCVLQTDFEADLEIAMLAKELGLTVMSNDSDFYMFDVPFIPLRSITYNKVTIGKKKRSNELFNYISCHLFNREKFCQITGMDPAHFPILATLLGNDYLAFDHFKNFYNHLEAVSKSSRMTTRHNTIKNVLTWLSQQKSNTTEQIINSVVRLCNSKNLKKRMRETMENYTDVHSNLISLVSKHASKRDLDSTTKENCQHKGGTFQDINLTNMTAVETSLFCRNGKQLPDWFVLAYRAHRIHHEAADILTQGYFISPPQVEDKVSASAYLLVEPIVSTIYTMLWQDSHLRDCAQGCSDNVMLSERSSVSRVLEPLLPGSSTVTEMYESDVVVEEDGEESLDDEPERRNEEMQHLKDEEKVLKSKGISNLSDSPLLDENLEVNYEVFIDDAENKNVHCVKKEEKDETDTDSEEVEAESCSEAENVEVNDGEINQSVHRTEAHQPRKECLKWYLRKGTRMWIKNVSLLPDEKARALPSLSDVESMAMSEKRKLFYTALNVNQKSPFSGLPDDLELILDFIIFWYQESTSPLIEVHVLSVLVCVFMFYVIDGKVGRMRTRKAFEDEEKWKEQFLSVQSEALYRCAGASVQDTRAQVSREECWLAGHRLFKFHHMDHNVSDKYYSKKTVHAFSEYQACIYFVQLLNTMLGCPFPLLSIEHLWGGTFCYNVFYDLKKRSKPLMRVSEILGKGTCLEKLFFVLFKQISEVLKFKKYLGIVDLLGNMNISENEKKNSGEIVAMSANTTIHNVQKKKKKKKRSGRRSNKKDNDSDRGRENSEKKETQEVEEESGLSPQDGTEEGEQVDLLDNRFAGLLLETH